jgi:hypothetical protein
MQTGRLRISAVMAVSIFNNAGVNSMPLRYFHHVRCY